MESGEWGDTPETRVRRGCGGKATVVRLRQGCYEGLVIQRC